MPKKREPKSTRLHADLEEIRLEVTEFGEIAGSLDIDKINDFLNLNLEDPKLNLQDKL